MCNLFETESRDNADRSPANAYACAFELKRVEDRGINMLSYMLYFDAFRTLLFGKSSTSTDVMYLR